MTPKKKLKKYEELCIKTRELIRSITKNSDDYDEKYMKIKFNSNDELPLNKTIVDDISYKTFMGKKPLPIRFDEIDGFIKI